MIVLTEKFAKRIAKLLNQLRSDDANVHRLAINAMKRDLEEHGLSLSDIAIVIENAKDEDLAEKKYSDDDAQAIFTRGVEEGRKQNTGLETAFVNNDGTPRWREMAKFCDNCPGRTTLKPNEQDVVSKMQYFGSPASPNQGGYFLSIFFRMRGSLK